ncbi:unnamed protein product [Ilex paraguariensis]|uniref:CRAL-TRIO domain-containing protein n=1 Tax=Ilex paraguariensis TaxID=185542 RepID=A0ABC8UKD3_9AQUA
MGDSLCINHSSKSLEPRVAKAKKLSKYCLVASIPKGFSPKTSKCITLVKRSIQGSGAAGDVGVFLLTTAALEIMRRFSRAKCPLVWRVLQALQVLCYPPFKWVERWAPFKVLVKHMQTLSRPMLVLTIATVFSEQSFFTKETSNNLDDSQGSFESEPPDTSKEKWLLKLHKELENQGITLPQRLGEDELCRFYSIANGDFSRLLSSVKKTIYWRQNYTLFSPEELEAWSRLVFWHGSDVNLCSCLIIRLGLACSNLRPNDMSLFVKAVVSQIEHGVVNLVHTENPRITVVMDCKGLSPLGFPMQMMRSCAILLQDHYPNRLGLLIVIRLPLVARVITKTLFQVLKPATRQKLRIVGENYQKVLSEYLQTLPLFLGGKCLCSKCSELGNRQGPKEEIIWMRRRLDLSNDANVPSPALSNHADARMNWNREHTPISTLIFGVLMLSIFIAFAWRMRYPERPPLFYWPSGS